MKKYSVGEGGLSFVKYLYQEEFSELFKDCTAAELDSLLKIVQEIKSSLRAKKED